VLRGPARFLIHDSDSRFSTAFDEVVHRRRTSVEEFVAAR
jgi:hypothetical protein